MKKVKTFIFDNQSTYLQKSTHNLTWRVLHKMKKIRPLFKGSIKLGGKNPKTIGSLKQWKPTKIGSNLYMFIGSNYKWNIIDQCSFHLLSHFEECSPSVIVNNVCFWGTSWNIFYLNLLQLAIISWTILWCEPLVAFVLHVWVMEVV